jgi:hypothetical protein
MQLNKIFTTITILALSVTALQSTVISQAQNTAISDRFIEPYTNFNNYNEDRITLAFYYTDEYSQNIRLKQIEQMLGVNGPDKYSDPAAPQFGTTVFTSLFQTFPFNEHKNKFNILLQKTSVLDGTGANKTSKGDVYDNFLGNKRIIPIFVDFDSSSVAGQHGASYLNFDSITLSLPSRDFKDEIYTEYLFTLFTHELAHAIGKLNDEYSQGTDLTNSNPINCSKDLNQAKQLWGSFEGKKSKGYEVIKQIHSNLNSQNFFYSESDYLVAFNKSNCIIGQTESYSSSKYNIMTGDDGVVSPFFNAYQESILSRELDKYNKPVVVQPKPDVVTPPTTTPPTTNNPSNPSAQTTIPTPNKPATSTNPISASTVRTGAPFALGAVIVSLLAFFTLGILLIKKTKTQ